MLNVTSNSIGNILTSSINKVSISSKSLEKNYNLDKFKDEINTNNVDINNDIVEISSGDEISALFRSNLELAELQLAMYSDEKSFIEAELMGIRSIVETGARTSSGGKVETHINESEMAVFETPDYIIETDVNKGGHSVFIKDKEGETLARIHGDPHVDINNDGEDDFHFGDDSRLLLNDGTEIFLNTENMAGTEEAGDYTHDKIFYTKGIYVKNGDQTFMTGESYHQKDVVKNEIVEGSLPSENGSKEDGALTFALDEDANAYIKDDDSGKWHELEDESWDGYLADPTFDDQIGAETDFSVEGSPEFDSPLTAEYRAREAELESELAQLDVLVSSSSENVAVAQADYQESLRKTDDDYSEEEIDELKVNMENSQKEFQDQIQNSSVYTDEFKGLTQDLELGEDFTDNLENIFNHEGLALYKDRDNNQIHQLEDGLIVSGVSEDGLGFMRTDIFDNNNYTQNNDDGSIYEVKHGLIRSGTIMKDGENLEFTRTYILDNNNYDQFYDNGKVDLVKDGEVTETIDIKSNNDFLKWTSMEDLGDLDLTLVDSHQKEFNQLMGAISVKELNETIDYHGENRDSILASAHEASSETKELLVKQMLSIFGSDNSFMDIVTDKGLEIVIVDDIEGENSNGEEFNGVGAYYNPETNQVVLRDQQFNRVTFAHELIHARDYLVDGKLDGVLDDHEGFEHALNISRDKVNNNIGVLHIGQQGLDYAKTNDRELLAVLFENYQTNPNEFRADYGEMAQQFDKLFSHVDEIVGQLSDNDYENYFENLKDFQILA